MNAHASKMATTENNATKIHELLLADRRLKVRQLVYQNTTWFIYRMNEKAVGAMGAAFADSE